jgi:hypothetical protein
MLLFGAMQIFIKYVSSACRNEQIFENLFGDYEVSCGEAT